MANLAPVPDGLSDEQVLMCLDILSTGFGGAETGRVRIGDIVAIFAQGPIWLCAMAGGRPMAAATIIGVESIHSRAELARKMGAHHYAGGRLKQSPRLPARSSITTRREY